MRTLIKNNDEMEKIIINKDQHKYHIEVAPTTEEKLIKLHNYLENNNIKKKEQLLMECAVTDQLESICSNTDLKK